MMLLLLRPSHSSWSIFVIVPLVVLGFIWAVSLIVSGLRGLLRQE